MICSSLFPFWLGLTRYKKYQWFDGMLYDNGIYGIIPLICVQWWLSHWYVFISFFHDNHYLLTYWSIESPRLVHRRARRGHRQQRRRRRRQQPRRVAGVGRGADEAAQVRDLKGRGMGKTWEDHGKIMGKWWKNDGKMTEKWWENDGWMMGKWWKRNGKWWINDGKMMET